MFDSLLFYVLGRYAIAIVSSAAAGAAGFAATQWGWSPDMVAIVGGAFIVIALVLVAVISRNSSVAAVIARLPVRPMLKAVADATHAKVGQIQLTDPDLAAAVPSPKVVAMTPDPAGNGNVSG